MAEAMMGEGNPIFNSVEVTCEWCGDTRLKIPAKMERDDHHFCSHDCHNKWMAENQVGPDHHQWKGGRPDYGEGWTPKKRERVRERAGRRCEGCGMPEAELLEQSNRKLHVHHKIPAKKIDDPEERNAVENLTALCIGCHRKAESMAPLYPFAD